MQVKQVAHIHSTANTRLKHEKEELRQRNSELVEAAEQDRIERLDLVVRMTALGLL